MSKQTTADTDDGCEDQLFYQNILPEQKSFIKNAETGEYEIHIKKI